MLTAVHEAGHVVVAYCLRKSVVFARIGKDRDTGEMSCEWRDGDGWTAEKLRAEVSIASGGEVAEMTWHIKGGRMEEARLVSLDGSNIGDRLKAKVAAGVVGKQLSIDRDEVFSAAQTLAVELLRDHWSVVLAVANALNRDGALSADELYSFLEIAPQGSCAYQATTGLCGICSAVSTAS
jgi:hypothetical protein